MPLRSPVPPAFASLATYVGYLESAIVSDDAVNVNRYMIDLTNILGAAYQSGLGEADPLALEVEGIIASASRWLRDRVAAGAGGQGITYSASDAGDISYDDATAAGVATVDTLRTSAVRDIYANLTLDQVHEGETLRDAVARIYRAMYGGDAPAIALVEVPDIEPSRVPPSPPPDFVQTPTGWVPPPEGIPPRTTLIPFDGDESGAGAPRAGAPAGSPALWLGLGLALLFVLRRKR